MIDMVIDIVEADYVAPYKIHLWFSDSSERCVDFEPFLKTSTHPEIKKYLNPALFKNFSIAYGKLDWNDIDLCFPIQDLYEGNIS